MKYFICVITALLILSCASVKLENPRGIEISCNVPGTRIGWVLSQNGLPLVFNDPHINYKIKWRNAPCILTPKDFKPVPPINETAFKPASFILFAYKPGAGFKHNNGKQDIVTAADTILIIGGKKPIPSKIQINF